MSVQFIPVHGIPIVEEGDDLVALILDAVAAGPISLEPGDIVVVTGKIVSKAEGRVVDLTSIRPSARARRLAARSEKDPRLVELVLRESRDVIRVRPGRLFVRHRLGYVSAMAGIDRSNLSGDDNHALLLPEDPDRTAAEIRAGLMTATGVPIGVLVTDSHGRPFRVGNVGVALGAAGVPALQQLAGMPDLFGRPLTVASVVPIADLIAAGAMLVSGEANEGIPVVVVRGVPLSEAPGQAADLIRDPERDLFAIADEDYS